MGAGDDGEHRWRSHLEDDEWPEDAEPGLVPRAMTALRRQWEVFSTGGPTDLLDHALQAPRAERWWVLGVMALIPLSLVLLVVVAWLKELASWAVDAVSWLDRAQMIDTIALGVGGYLHEHGQGLAVSSDVLFTTWAVLVPAIWLWSMLLRSFGARLAWVLLGALTTAMVWAGTVPASR